MKQTMRKWTEIGRKGMALLLALVMVLGVCMPVYATGDATEPTEPTTPETTLATEPETVETTAPAEPAAQAETSEPAVEPAEEESSEPEATVGDDALGVPETTEPETTVGDDALGVPETTVPETTVGDDALGVPDTTVPEQVVTDDESVQSSAPEKSAYEVAMEKLAAKAEEAKTLEATEEALDAFCDDLYELANYIADLWDSDQITEDQYTEAENQAMTILAYLETTYGYADGKIQTLATIKADETLKQTVTQDGLNIHLFDYGGGLYEPEYDSAGRQIFPLIFMGSGYVGEAWPDSASMYLDVIAHDYPAKFPTITTLWSNYLGDDGYPFLRPKIAENQYYTASLKKYFDKAQTAETKTPYDKSYRRERWIGPAEAGHGYYSTSYDVLHYPVSGGLFSKEGNYFVFNSRNNHAYYDYSTRELKVAKNYAISPGYNVDGRYTETGHFLPFTGKASEYDSTVLQVRAKQNATYSNSNAYADYPKNIDYIETTADKLYAFTLPALGQTVLPEFNYEATVKNRVDMYLGASVDFKFNQPKGGRLLKAGSTSTYEDMVYEFSGDDQMVVYIDGIKVLDLGWAPSAGLGGSKYATINFNTGVVRVYMVDCTPDVHGNNPKYYTEKTLRQCFEEAVSAGADITVSDYFAEGSNTFKDYLTLDFDMFYMDTGASTSNLMLKFNMDPLPTNTITVMKEVEETTTTKEFDFQVEFKNQDNEPLTSVNYKVNGVGEEKTMKLTDGKGTFKLKDGEKYMFLGVTAGTQYKVTELDANEDGYKTASIGETSGSMDDEPIVCGYVNVYQPDDEDGDKTVSEKGLDEFILSLNAFTYGTEFESSSRVPTDIVLAIDTSGSMHQLTVTASQPTRVYDYTTEYYDTSTQPYVDYIADSTWLNATTTEKDTGLELAPYARVVRDSGAVKRALNNKQYLNAAKDNKYYVLNGAEYTEIKWCTTCGKWHPADAKNCTTVYTPKKSPIDTEGVQFYTVGNVSRMDATIHALVDFINAVKKQTAENNTEHRISIVSFQDRTLNTNLPYHTGLWNGETMYSYLNPTELTAKYSSAFTNMTAEDAASKLFSSLKGISDTPYHSVGTFPTPGIEMAKGIFDAYSIEGTDRNRVFVMFTDGTPTYPDGEHDYEDARTPALEAAKALKKDVENLQVYSVGMFDGANVDKSDISNNFCHWVSSNVDMELGTIQAPDTSLLANYSTVADQYTYVYKGKGVWTGPAINRDGGYYFPATSADELNNAFSAIITNTVGGTESQLNEKSVMRDILSEHVKFDGLAVDAEAATIAEWINDNVKFYTQDYKGNDTFDPEKVPYTEALTVEVDPVTKTINVTGFPYDEHWCGPVVDANGVITEYHGKRLVVEFPVESDSVGGNQLPTNKAPDSGVYVDGTSTKPVIEFPLPYVDISTKVTLKKLVRGNMGDWSKLFDFDIDGKTIQPVDSKYYFESQVSDSKKSNASNYLEAYTSDYSANPEMKHEDTQTISTLRVDSELIIKEDPDVYTLDQVLIYIDEDGDGVKDDEETVVTGTPVYDDPDAEDKKQVGIKVNVQPKMQIEFTNKYEVTIDTGIALDSLPYMLIIAVVLVGGAFLFLRKRKPQED